MKVIVTSIKKLRQQKEEQKDYTYYRKSIFLPGSKIHKNIFTITYPNGKTFSETHKQKIYQL
ncbi:MAG: hypothetical protein MZV64_07465 [Ignavibacteriales bacterium]|nr:hypothetical protein [Ignavibacteriales bacterium]